MKNIKSTNKANTVNNEGYGLFGLSNEGWDDIINEGDGLASKRKPLTAWAVEIDGEISPCDIVSTRSFAREVRKDIAYNLSGYATKVSVRKVLIVAIAGR